MALPTDDAWLTMPPEPLEYQGRAEIAGFFQTRSSWRARPARLVPTRASGQPAFGYYRWHQPGPAGPGPAGPSPVRLGQGLIVLSCAGDQIAAITRFRGSLLPLFGLPASLPD